MESRSLRLIDRLICARRYISPWVIFTEAQIATATAAKMLSTPINVRRGTMPRRGMNLRSRATNRDKTRGLADDAEAFSPIAIWATARSVITRQGLRSKIHSGQIWSDHG